MVELDCLHKGFKLGIVFRSFAREADDERGAKRDARYASPDAVEELFVRGTSAGPLHPLEDAIGRVLERQIDVEAQLLALRHRFEYVVADRGGVEVEHTHPLESIHAVQCPQQTPERTA